MQIKKETGICKLSMIPVRNTPSNMAEMTTMLLFGETYSMIEEQGEWVYIVTDEDAYHGWINIKLHNALHTMPAKSLVFNCFPAAMASGEQTGDVWILPGSLLPDFTNNEFSINNERFAFPFDPSKQNTQSASALANNFINAPYLWGGKSLFGIDCSGLTQVVFRMMGKKLLRDAAQQATQGETVAFRMEARDGDLAFFDNDEGKITHVGIMVDSNRIIHASGKVRIDQIDDYGIINSQSGQYSHKLRIIKRNNS
jgi:cell wall-associated NlpC family hydrolase